MSISRSKAAQMGKETIAILAAGHYTSPSGQAVDITEPLRRAVEGTVGYPPDAAFPSFAAGSHPPRYQVENTTTLAAARKLAREGHRVVALNFASARHPGGGFLNGARAQEESLCRVSGLYACIENDPMYAYHAGEGGGWYSNYAIFSPDVPVIRDEDGDLLDEPFLCSFITSPAVNAGAVRDRSHNAIRAEMARRVRKVLAVAAGHAHDTIVLGAWGCGVFRNDPEMVAELFREALGGEFHGVFARVMFAVLDESADGHFIGPFERQFRGR